jgi:hypothetical protein
MTRFTAELGLSRASDQAILDRAAEEDRVLISSDTDFSMLLAQAHCRRPSLILFEIVNRQRLDRRTGLPIQTPRPPEPTENGLKDTVIAYPGEVTQSGSSSPSWASTCGTATSSSTRTTR